MHGSWRIITVETKRNQKIKSKYLDNVSIYGTSFQDTSASDYYYN